MQDIVKEFPGVRALDGVNFELFQNDILALVGENGAGKSTLMKVLSGVYTNKEYSGKIFRNGKEQQFSSTTDAEKAGIAIIHQELNLFPELSVSENLFIGRYIHKNRLALDWERMHGEANDALQHLGLSFAPQTLVKELSVGDQQMVEIARALMKKTDILILDEPTSALSEIEIKRLYELIFALRDQGTSCIYISHKMDEIYTLCNRTVVLRDGATVGQGSLPQTTQDQLIAMMVGREMNSLYPNKEFSKNTHVNLEVKALSTQKIGSKSLQTKDVDFTLRSGEILGIGGMMGSGRTEILYSIFGHPDYDTKGCVKVDGKEIKLNDMQDSIAAGIGFVTEDRKVSGLHLGMTIKHNVAMADLSALSTRGIIDDQKECALANEFIEALKIKTPTRDQLVNNLSGGNQQKVAIAKWCARNPKVLMLDEPTRGVDVGAKFEIYSLIRNLAKSGMSVIVVSSEIPELLGLCHRVKVMRDGMLCGDLHGDNLTPENIVKYAVGEQDDA